MALARPEGMPGPPPPPAKPPSRPWVWLAVIAVIGGMWLLQSSAGNAERPAIEYSTLLDWVRAGKVKEVVLAPDNLSGTLAQPEKLDGKTVTGFHAALPKDERLVPLLDDKRVKIRVDNEESSALARLAMMLLPWVLI